MASTAWLSAPPSRADDLWTCLASEDADDGEGVFSVLNLDHDRFLEELDRGQVAESVSSVCGRLAAMKTQALPDAAGGDVNAPVAPAAPVSPCPAAASARDPARPNCKALSLERMRSRMAADVSRGRGCSLLRANINAMRRPRAGSTAAPAGLGRDWLAAQVLQAAWRRFVLRHAFLHLREVVRQLAASESRVALQSINPREAPLADAASDIVVRFRLAGDDSSLLPVLVYKMFTRRPVVDVCRGCCGRLADCSGAGTATARSAPAARSRSYLALCGGGCRRSQSVCCLLFASYKRVENNDWRHCRVGLFDPERCPARGAARSSGAAYRRQPAANVKRAIPGTAPGALGAPPAPAAWTGPAKKKLSAQERERLAKMALLRKLYGYGQGDVVVCPPPSPSTSSKRTATLVQDIPVPTPMVPVADAAGEAGEQDVASTARLGQDGRGPDQGDEYSRVSDAYYDRLMASWGL